MGRSLHPILEFLLLYDSLLLGPALVRLKSALLCLPSSFLQGMRGKNTCEILGTLKTGRDPHLPCCSDFEAFLHFPVGQITVLPDFRWCGSNISYCVPTLVPKITDVEILDTVIFHSIHDKKTVGFGDQRHLWIWKKLFWVYSSFVNAVAHSDRSQVWVPSAGTLCCSVVLLLFTVNGGVWATAARYPGFSSAAELHLFSGVYSLKNMVAISRKTTETRSVGLVFYFRYYMVL